MKKIQDEIEDELKAAYIDSIWNSNLAYRPEFVSNDHKAGKNRALLLSATGERVIIVTSPKCPYKSRDLAA